MKESTAFKLVKDELDRALADHGNFNSTHEGYAIILEELDELWDEIKANQGTTDRGVSEAVQIAAMAIRYLTNLCEDVQAIEHERKVVEHRESTPPHDSWGGYSG